MYNLYVRLAKPPCATICEKSKAILKKFANSQGNSLIKFTFDLSSASIHYLIEAFFLTQVHKL